MDSLFCLANRVLNNLLLTRLFWLGCQALFGLLPVFIIPNSLHYTFYSSTLVISYVGMFMLGINDVANLRWARSEPRGKKLQSYFFLMLLCGIIPLLIYLLFFEKNYLIILVVISGLIRNFKTLGLSYLRNSSGDKVSLFMVKDGLIFLAGSLGLFLVNSELSLTILLSLTICGGIVFLLPAIIRAINIGSFSFRLRTINHLFLIIKDSVFMFFSAFFITYIPIIARSAVEYTQNDDYFVAFSVALSIAVNIQKVSLAYYWVLQKRYWSEVSQGILKDQNIIRLGLLTFGTCAVILLAQRIFDHINSNIEFPLIMIAISIMVTLHRMSVSFYRLHLMTVMSVFGILANQVKLLIFLSILGFISYPLLGQQPLLLYVALILFCDIIFVYHLPLWRRTNINQ